MLSQSKMLDDIYDIHLTGHFTFDDHQLHTLLTISSSKYIDVVNPNLLGVLKINKKERSIIIRLHRTRLLLGTPTGLYGIGVWPYLFNFKGEINCCF